MWAVVPFSELDNSLTGGVVLLGSWGGCRIKIYLPRHMYTCTYSPLYHSVTEAWWEPALNLGLSPGIMLGYVCSQSVSKWDEWCMGTPPSTGVEPGWSCLSICNVYAYLSQTKKNQKPFENWNLSAVPSAVLACWVTVLGISDTFYPPCLGTALLLLLWQVN